MVYHYSDFLLDTDLTNADLKNFWKYRLKTIEKLISEKEIKGSKKLLNEFIKNSEDEKVNVLVRYCQEHYSSYTSNILVDFGCCLTRINKAV